MAYTVFDSQIQIIIATGLAVISFLPRTINMAGIFSASDPSSPGCYGPGQTALLLLDFHTMFVEKAAGPNGVYAASAAASLRSWALSRGIHIVHCLLDLTATPFETCKNAARIEQTVKIMRSSDGAGQEWPALVRDAAEMDSFFTRRPGHVSALRSPGLELFLEKKGIRSLILTGLSTSGCVMRTAVSASDAEYVVTVVSDTCAEADQVVHDMVIEKLINRGHVVVAEELRQQLERVQSPSIAY